MKKKKKLRKEKNRNKKKIKKKGKKKTKLNSLMKMSRTWSKMEKNKMILTMKKV